MQLRVRLAAHALRLPERRAALMPPHMTPQVWDAIAAEAGPRTAAVDGLGSALEAAGAGCSSCLEAALAALVEAAMAIGHLDPGQVGGGRGKWSWWLMLGRGRCRGPCRETLPPPPCCIGTCSFEPPRRQTLNPPAGAQNKNRWSAWWRRRRWQPT